MFLAALPICLEASWDPARGQPLSVEIGSMESGLEDITWEIVWDSDGIAYLARERIWRWDGTELMPVGPDIFTEMHAISFDRQGRLLVGGINEFGIFDPRTEAYVSLMDRLPPEHREFGRAWAIHDDGKTIWMGSHDRLFQIGPESTQVHVFEGRHRVVFHFLDSGVYAHEPEVGLWRVEDQKLDLLNVHSELMRNAVMFLEDRSDDNLFGLSSAGAFIISDLGKGRVDHTVLEPILDLPVSAVERIDDTKLIVATLTEGLFLLNTNTKDSTLIEIQEIAPKHLIVSIGQAPNGGVWVAGDSSIEIIATQLKVGISDNSIAKSSGYLNSFCKFKGALLMTSSAGLLFFPSGDLGGEFSQLTDDSCGKIVGSIQGLVFVEYSALKLLSHDGASVEELVDFGREIWTFSIVGERLVVGFSDRLEVYRWIGDKTLVRLHEQPLSAGFRVLEADASGTLWGWDPYRPLLMLRWTEEGGLEQIHHEEVGGLLLRDHQHQFAMTTEGPVLLFEDRIARWRPQEERWESAGLEFQGGDIEAMTFRASGDALEGWLVSWEPELKSHLLTEVNWESGGLPVLRRLPWIGMRDLGRIKRIATFEDEEPEFLISGLKGILFAARDLSDDISVPGRPVLFHGGRRLWGDSTIEVDHGETVLRFRYSSPGGSTYYPVRYQTRLSGREADWSEPSDLPVRELGLLWEGRYTFEVRAVDPFGRPSEAATVPIRIYPPWFRTPWAIVLYLLTATGLLSLVVFLQGHKLRRRQAWLEGEVRKRTVELQEANQFKDDFIANLSHEIRNPLNGVIGSIRQLNPRQALPERTLKSLRGAAHYLQTTVEEVLDFAKLESGEIRTEESAFDLGEIVDGILEIHRPTAAEKGVSLRSRIRIPDGMAVVSDARKVQQIIGNLVGNAVKFTKSGSVSLGLSLKPGSDRKAALRVWVEDSGPGIPAGEQTRVFEKFYQGKTASAKTAGTGIGLSLVKRFVEALGGWLELKSEPGRGSTFIVNLTVGVQPLPESSGIVPENRDYGGIRVLIVEDLEYNRIILEDFLEGIGCVTESADNGRDAVEKAGSGDFAVILLDWELPFKSGLEVARELRADPAFPDKTLIVGMTAYATAEDQQACLDAGMDVFLSKPVSQQQLLGILDRVPCPGRLLEGLGLLAEMSSDEVVHETLERWAGYHTGYRAELESAMAGGDVEAVRKTAHRLLGHLRMLELVRLPGIVSDLMTTAQSGDKAGLQREWKELRPLMDQLEREVKDRIIAGRSPPDSAE